MFKEKLKKALLAAVIAFVGALGGFVIPDDAFGQPGNYTIPHDHSSKGKGGTILSPLEIVLQNEGNGITGSFESGDISGNIEIGVNSLYMEYGDDSIPQYDWITFEPTFLTLERDTGEYSTLSQDGLITTGTVEASGATFSGDIDVVGGVLLFDGGFPNQFIGDNNDDGNLNLYSGTNNITLNDVSGAAGDVIIGNDLTVQGNTLLSGELVVAGDITKNGGTVYGERTAISESAESRDTTTAITNDNNISAGIGVGTGFWEYYGILRFSTGSDTPDLTLEFNFAGSAGSFVNDLCYITAYSMDTGALLYKDYLAMDLLSADIQLASGDNAVIEFNCIFEAVGGTVNAYVAWGPQVSDATPVIRQAGSYSVVRQLK